MNPSELRDLVQRLSGHAITVSEKAEVLCALRDAADALERSDDAMSIVRWFLSGDNGSSSEAVVAHMTGNVEGYHGWMLPPPCDPDDLGRCLRLLEQHPAWALRIHEMAQYGPGWAGLCAQWNAIASSMAEEVGIDWSKGKNAPRTYRLMWLAEADGYRRDPNYDCTFTEDGRLSTASPKPSSSTSPDHDA